MTFKQKGQGLVEGLYTNFLMRLVIIYPEGSSDGMMINDQTVTICVQLNPAQNKQGKER